MWEIGTITAPPQSKLVALNRSFQNLLTVVLILLIIIINSMLVLGTPVYTVVPPYKKTPRTLKSTVFFF